MESREVLEHLRTLDDQNQLLINLLRRIEAILLAQTGKVIVEGSHGRLIAVDGPRMSSQEMLEFVDPNLKLLKDNSLYFVWDSMCPRGVPDHLYQIPADRDVKNLPLSYKEARHIMNVLQPARDAWLYEQQEKQRSET